MKQELEDLKEEHSRERQEYEQTQEELMRELKLKSVESVLSLIHYARFSLEFVSKVEYKCSHFRTLIIDNFIPTEDKKKLQDRAVFDEDEDSWMLKALAKDGSVFVMTSQNLGRLKIIVRMLIMKLISFSKRTQTMAKRPKSALPGGKRAVTDFAKMAAYHNGNIRYKVKTNLSLKSSRNSKCYFCGFLVLG